MARGNSGMKFSGKAAAEQGTFLPASQNRQAPPFVFFGPWYSKLERHSNGTSVLLPFRDFINGITDDSNIICEEANGTTSCRFTRDGQLHM